jgi:hypothetical protein
MESAFISWCLSGILHMVAGGYICYRFRPQIDKARAVAEPIALAVYHKVFGK